MERFEFSCPAHGIVATRHHMDARLDPSKCHRCGRMLRIASDAHDPVGIILQALQAIYAEYPAHRREWSAEGSLDATLRMVLTADDFDAVREFHAGRRDDEYGLDPEEGGRVLYGRLVHSVESYSHSQPTT